MRITFTEIKFIIIDDCKIKGISGQGFMQNEEEKLSENSSLRVDQARAWLVINLGGSVEDLVLGRRWRKELFEVIEYCD